MEENKSSEVVVDINLEENDAYKFNLWQTYKGSAVRPAIIIALIGLIYFLSLLGRIINEGYRPPAYAYLFLFVIAGLLCIPFYIKKSVHKAVEENNFTQQTMHCRFTEKEIQVKSEKSHIELSWDRIFGVLENRNYFAVYTSKSQMLLIPKRSFNNSEDINILRDIIKSSLSRDKYKLKTTAPKY